MLLLILGHPDCSDFALFRYRSDPPAAPLPPSRGLLRRNLLKAISHENFAVVEGGFSFWHERA